ncbi:helix-turn-helix transcriptional regulator [Photobacterium damselae]|uniref:helix-turn-helix transcriptional regulator n=1 Tax=Photobacterium damselae TaxID=38293 RepID=UPI00165D38F4|nr:AlpA family phage regulatory protein [Photobacterium damselae]
MQDIADNFPERLVSENECCKLTGLSRTTRWELEKKGAFPVRQKIGERRVVWLWSELHQWMQSLPQPKRAAS